MYAVMSVVSSHRSHVVGGQTLGDREMQHEHVIENAQTVLAYTWPRQRDAEQQHS
jgi:hypothetical protein